MNGLVHIYSGEGKGKTTASVGLCVRSAGWGKNAAFYEFIKGSQTGEAAALKRLGVFVYCPVETEKFVFTMTAEEKAACMQRQTDTLQHASENMHKYDLLVLDEALSAIDAGVLTKQALVEFIKNKNPETELVITGRGIFDEISQLSDYISEISAKKHPYDKGIRARKGIEY